MEISARTHIRKLLAEKVFELRKEIRKYKYRVEFSDWVDSYIFGFYEGVLDFAGEDFMNHLDTQNQLERILAIQPPYITFLESESKSLL